MGRIWRISEAKTWLYIFCVDFPNLIRILFSKIFYYYLISFLVGIRDLGLRVCGKAEQIYCFAVLTWGRLLFFSFNFGDKNC